MRKTVRNVAYYLRDANTGGTYLTERTNRTVYGKYRWVKDKNQATLLSYDAAQKARLRYGGTLVRKTFNIVEESV